MMGRWPMGHPEGLGVSVSLLRRVQHLPPEPSAVSWSSVSPVTKCWRSRPASIRRGPPPGMLHIVGPYNKFPE